MCTTNYKMHTRSWTEKCPKQFREMRTRQRPPNRQRQKGHSSFYCRATLLMTLWLVWKFLTNWETHSVQLGKICNHNNVIHNAFQNYDLLAKQNQIMIQITAVHCLIPALLSWLKNVSKKLHSPSLASRFYIPFSLILTFSIFYCVLENTISTLMICFPSEFSLGRWNSGENKSFCAFAFI